MFENLGILVLELAVLIGIALVYYFYQRHRILHGPRNWRHDKLPELHQMAIYCTLPEQYPDLSALLDDIEQRIESRQEIDLTFLTKWESKSLPENILASLKECKEWTLYSQANP
jgi:hypothetical protein